VALANPGAVVAASEIAAGAAGVTGTASAAALGVKGATAAVAGKARRAAGEFTRGQRNGFKRENTARNGGKMKCDDCVKSVRSVGSEKGVKTPSDQAQVHHDPAIKNGGGKHSEGKVLCPECHIKRHENEK